MCLGDNGVSAVYENVEIQKTRFKCVPVKWRGCCCAGCPLVLASSALFTQFDSLSGSLYRCCVV